MTITVTGDALPKATVCTGCPRKGRGRGRAKKGEQRRFLVVEALCGGWVRTKDEENEEELKQSE